MHMFMSLHLYTGGCSGVAHGVGREVSPSPAVGHLLSAQPREGNVCTSLLILESCRSGNVLGADPETSRLWGLERLSSSLRKCVSDSQGHSFTASLGSRKGPQQCWYISQKPSLCDEHRLTTLFTYCAFTLHHEAP